MCTLHFKSALYTVFGGNYKKIHEFYFHFHLKIIWQSHPRAQKKAGSFPLTSLQLPFSRFFSHPSPPPPLGHKQVATELPNGFQDFHPMMFSLIVSTMYFTSSSLTYGPAGRHIPTLNKASDTPLTYAGTSL